jgi:hypothetical protein
VIDQVAFVINDSIKCRFSAKNTLNPKFPNLSVAIFGQVILWIIMGSNLLLFRSRRWAKQLIDCEFSQKFMDGGKVLEVTPGQKEGVVKRLRHFLGHETEQF